MQITAVKIKNLYGLHHYKIKFAQEACIKIIHAPNGYGKTTLLKLIDCVMYYRLEEIIQIPFTRFEITFDEDIKIEVMRQDENILEEIEYIITEGKDQRHYKCFVGEKQIEKAIEKQLEERLSCLREAMPIHLIHANRLLDEGEEKEKLIPAVLCYAKELKDLMNEALAKSAKLNEELDRNFPKRLLEVVNKAEDEEKLFYEKIQSDLESLERKRKTLEQVGLLVAGESQRVEITADTPQYVLKTLTLYIEESQKKLSVFDRLAPRIALMKEIINKRFTYKTMYLNQEDGFIFEVPYNGKLRANKLSSGEQNELILIYELLFKSQVNSLILIDEPEISLHIAWQQSFLEDMEKIAALTGVKLIIATHSPDIINGRWDLTTGLEEC